SGHVITTAPPSPTPPSSTGAPTISGSPLVGDTLSAGIGGWSGSNPITYGYQWERCNASGESCSTISGATMGAYTVQRSDLGHALRLMVTAENSSGSASAYSAITAVVSIPPNYEEVVETSSPVEWWRFSENSSSIWANWGSGTAALNGTGVVGGQEAIVGENPG